MDLILHIRSIFSSRESSSSFTSFSVMSWSTERITTEKTGGFLLLGGSGIFGQFGGEISMSRLFEAVRSCWLRFSGGGDVVIRRAVGFLFTIRTSVVLMFRLVMRKLWNDFWVARFSGMFLI
jgi:hypothetical protein